MRLCPVNPFFSLIFFPGGEKTKNWKGHKILNWKVSDQEEILSRYCKCRLNPTLWRNFAGYSMYMDEIYFLYHSRIEQIGGNFHWFLLSWNLYILKFAPDIWGACGPVAEDLHKISEEHFSFSMNNILSWIRLRGCMQQLKKENTEFNTLNFKDTFFKAA